MPIETNNCNNNRESGGSYIYNNYNESKNDECIEKVFDLTIFLVCMSPVVGILLRYYFINLYNN